MAGRVTSCLLALAVCTSAWTAAVDCAPCAGTKVVMELPPTAAHPRNSEGSFVRLKDGTLLFAWSRYYEAGVGENAGWDNGGADIACRRSADEGLTWAETDEILVRNDAMNVMSPSFLRLQDGRIALFYIRKLNPREDEVRMRTSADEAKTWSESVNVTAPLGKGWFVTNNDRVVQLKSGRLVVPVAWHETLEEGGIRGEATDVCLLSDDGGTTWRAGAKNVVWGEDGRRVSMQEPGVIELKDGRVMMWARTHHGGQYAGHSSDGGETWGPFALSDLVGPVTPASIRRLRDGALVAVWSDWRQHPEWKVPGRRAPLSLAVSRDEGRTWSASVSIEPDMNGHYCYTAVYERPDGLLLAYCCKQDKNLDRTRMTFVPKSLYVGLTDEQTVLDLASLKGGAAAMPGIPCITPRAKSCNTVKKGE